MPMPKGTVILKAAKRRRARNDNKPQCQWEFSGRRCTRPARTRFMCSEHTRRAGG
jgi:hypothetical protein